MERELGISYPTVRGRVDALVRALGLGDGEAADVEEAYEPQSDAVEAASAAAPDVAAERRAVLERLSRGELDATAAAAELRRLAGGQ
jgi:hypothetical protein